MRLNQFIASASNLSRRRADEAIIAGRVTINGHVAVVGEQASPSDHIELDGRALSAQPFTYVACNKPTGIVCSHRHQGDAKTIYEILPAQYRHLNTIGRLDKDSRGLIVLTNDGAFAERASHPRYEKLKRYLVRLDHTLDANDRQSLERGVMLDDGKSTLQIEQYRKDYLVSLHEGRNRQVRRSFEVLGYQVRFLQRVQFGNLVLGHLAEGKWREVAPGDII